MKAATRKALSAEQQSLELVISMTVLEDLGINLYGNVPAVLAETVANAWDADAKQVDISYDTTKKTIVIKDDGIGMTRDELQKFYLTVGHKRRVAGRTRTSKGRKPMGRKGIGKLSLFSIAEKVTVETIRKNEKTAIQMDVNEIRKKILASSDGRSRYHPGEIRGVWNFSKGTRITLSDLKKERITFGDDLRRRLARRFFILGAREGFDVRVSNKPLTAADRGYLERVEYLWTLKEGDGNSLIKEIARRAKKVITIISESEDPEVSGWIGTVHNSGDLARDGDNANAIALMVRGKLAAPDLLGGLSVRELASKYIVGEIYADFLDADDREDIATSDRQGFLIDDPRYVALINYLRRAVRQVVNDRTRLKSDDAEKEATRLIPAVEGWLNGLTSDRRDAARKLFGNINQIYFDNEEIKREHFKQAVIAHQIFDARDKLNKLGELSSENVEKLLSAYSEFDEYEAALYHGVARIRVDVIRSLEDQLDGNKVESVIRDYLQEHLWLLDPSWDRATEPVEAEKTIGQYLKKVVSKLSKAEKQARFDLVYRRSSERHIVVELKRYGRRVSLGELLDQVKKYSGALDRGLANAGGPHQAHQIVCVVGPNQDYLGNSGDRKNADRALAPYHGRLLTYDEMLKRSKNAYKDFLTAQEKKNKLVRLLESIVSG